MNTRIFLFVLSIQCIQPTFAIDSFSDQVEGYWKNDKYNITLEVREFRDGIEVLRLDRNDGWYSYDEISRNTFIDRDGNKYQLVNDNTLTFRDNRRRLQLTFHKNYRNDNNGNRDDRYDERYDTDRRKNAKGYANLSRLEGNWRNQRNGRSLEIDRKGSTLKLRTRNLKSTFRYNGRHTFKDQFGNKLTVLSRNKIKLTTRGYNGRSRIFNRVRKNDYRKNDYGRYGWDDD